MTSRPKAILIVTLRDVEDIEGLKKRISAINGVIRVDFNHLTCKLLVHYDDGATSTQRIKQEIGKLVQDAVGEDRRAASKGKK